MFSLIHLLFMCPTVLWLDRGISLESICPSALPLNIAVSNYWKVCCPTVQWLAQELLSNKPTLKLNMRLYLENFGSDQVMLSNSFRFSEPLRRSIWTGDARRGRGLRRGRSTGSMVLAQQGGSIPGRRPQILTVSQFVTL